VLGVGKPALFNFLDGGAEGVTGRLDDVRVGDGRCDLALPALRIRQFGNGNPRAH
jgi:hypothetical protein